MFPQGYILMTLYLVLNDSMLTHQNKKDDGDHC